MSTPGTPEAPRPSLDDTLNRIDAVLAEGESERCTIEHVTRDNGVLNTTRCQNQAVPGTYYCQPHTERYGVSAKPPALPFGYVTPAERDLVRNVTGLDTSFMTRTPEPPTEQPAAVETGPGWLARALNRLFT